MYTHPPNINNLTPPSSPSPKPVPIITPFRFGYTGQHCRRGGAGACGACRDASRFRRAAQKMVPLPSERWRDVRVSHTNRSGFPQGAKRPCRPRGTGRAWKNTPNGTRRVPHKQFHSRHTTCPGRIQKPQTAPRGESVRRLLRPGSNRGKPLRAVFVPQRLRHW